MDRIHSIPASRTPFDDPAIGVCPDCLLWETYFQYSLADETCRALRPDDKCNAKEGIYAYLEHIVYALIAI